MLQTHVPSYNKHVNFEDYIEGYAKAVMRSEALEKEAERDEDDGRNPTTGVWRLTESIIDEGDKTLQEVEVP